jgi:branched-chain amino acid transport system ATP-binding protein
MRLASMLTLAGVETFYGRSQVLFGVDLEIAAGQVVTLMGRNGMGKTTTVRSILGLTPPRRGTIRFEGHHVAGLPPHRIGRLGIGLVPEGRQIFPTLTVRENLIATSANRSHSTTPWTLQRIYDLFPRLGERHGQLGRSLSGGEQQMLAIGRALMTNPKLLVLDEATEGLAPLIREEIWLCVERLKSDRQSILLIDKNLSALKRIADRHFVMEKGEIVWAGTSAELAADAKVAHRYLGV